MCEIKTVTRLISTIETLKNSNHSTEILKCDHCNIGPSVGQKNT